MARFETDSLLAGAYKNLDDSRACLTHVFDTTTKKALCGKVKYASRTEDCDEEDTIATCPTCANKDPRSSEARAAVGDLPALESTVVAIGPYCWGKGKSNAEAIGNAKHNLPGGIYVKPGVEHHFVLVTVLGFEGVDGMGRIQYKRDGSATEIGKLPFKTDARGSVRLGKLTLAEAR